MAIIRNTFVIAASALFVSIMAVPVSAQDGERRGGGDGDVRERGDRGDRGDRGARRGGDRGGRGGEFGGRRGGEGFRFGGGGGRGRGGGGGFGGMGRFGGSQTPEFARRDLELMENELRLDDDQAAIVEVLLMDYLDAFEAATTAFRAEMTELRPPRPERTPEQEAERRAMIDEMRAMRDELREMTEQAEAAGETPENISAIVEERLQSLRERARATFGDRTERDPAEMERMRDGMRDLSRQWRIERAALKSEFLSSLLVVLNEQQQEQWPAFNRLLTREKTLRLGRFAGESIDLFRLVQELGLSEDDVARVAEALGAYELALDQALATRNEFLDNDRFEVFDAMRNRDIAKALSIVARENDVRLAVRTVNEQYLDVIGATLAESSEDDAERLRQAFRERAFARILRPTATQRAFDVARSIEDLDEDVLISVLGLEEQYQIELGVHNDQLMEITRLAEPKQTEDRTRRMAARMNDEEYESSDPIREAFDKRGELDARFRKQLESVLTPEQAALLPEVRERGRGGEGRGRRGADGAEGRGRRGGDGGPGRGRRGGGRDRNDA